MRKSFGVKPILYPMPVFIIGSYDENGTPDAMNAAWGGISEADEISLCLSAGHKSVKNILASGAFSVSMATADTVAMCDYVGMVSANDVHDKLSRAGLHAEKCENVNAPMFSELPMTLECRLKSYDGESCRMVGEIVNVCADESVLTDGAIDPAKLRPITYDAARHGYYVLGEKVGNAFADGAALK